MRESGWRIGRIGPTPLHLARSWPVGVLLLAVLYFTALSGSMAPAQAIGYALVAVAGLFASVLVHEVSHGLAGHLLRRPPQSYTLTIWGGHTSFSGPERRPADMALIALAGPLSNLVVAGLCWAALLLAKGAYFHILAPLSYLNLALGVFNLLPGLPMDGGHVVHAIGWAVTGKRDSGLLLAGNLGRVVAVGVGAFGLVPLLQGRSTSSLWPLVIAVFLWQGASQAVRVATARKAVAGVDLRSWMAPAWAVDAGARVGDVPPIGAVVVQGGQPVAVVTVAALQQGADPALPVSAVARAIASASVLRVAQGADAVAALGEAARHGDVVVLVDGPRLFVGDVPRIVAHLKR